MPKRWVPLLRGAGPKGSLGGCVHEAISTYAIENQIIIIESQKNEQQNPPIRQKQFLTRKVENIFPAVSFQFHKGCLPLPRQKKFNCFENIRKQATTGTGDIRSRLRKIPETWPCILESLQAGGRGSQNLIWYI
jgi:hypothetical protein